MNQFMLNGAMVNDSGSISIATQVPASNIKVQSVHPSITATKFVIVEVIKANGLSQALSPTLVAIWNANITTIPPPVVEIKGYAPSLATSGAVNIAPEAVNIKINGKIPQISAIIGAPVLTTTQIDDFIRLEWQVA